MSTDPSKATGKAVASGSSQGDGLAALSSTTTESWVPRKATYEDTLSDSARDAAWRKIYAASPSANTEAGQKALRAAFYLYALVNGTSRAGAYKGTLYVGDGSTPDASILLKGPQPQDIRRFFRSNMSESYDLLKRLDLAEIAPRKVQQAADLGIRADVAFATADWLKDCPKFTPEEKLAHAASFQYGITRSRGARDGRPLEEVERDRVRAALAAEGAGVHGSAGSGPVEF